MTWWMVRVRYDRECSMCHTSVCHGCNAVSMHNICQSTIPLPHHIYRDHNNAAFPVSLLYGGRTVPKIKKLRIGEVTRNFFKATCSLRSVARDLQNVAQLLDFWHCSPAIQWLTCIQVNYPTQMDGHLRHVLL